MEWYVVKRVSMLETDFSKENMNPFAVILFFVTAYNYKGSDQCAPSNAS